MSVPPSLVHRHAVEDFVGRYLLQSVNDVLAAELSFTKLKYVPPATAILTDVVVEAEGRSFIEARSVTFVFTEVPRKDAPIVIEQIRFVDPVIRLIGKPDGENRATKASPMTPPLKVVS